MNTICPRCGRGLSAKYRKAKATHLRFVSRRARRSMSRDDLKAARLAMCKA